MTNLATAREALEKTRSLEAIISPPPKKSARLPLQRDINLIQSVLLEKIDAKERILKDKMLDATNAKWAVQISDLHAKAATLRKDVNQLKKAVEADSGEAVTIDTDDHYGGYWGKLPETAKAAEDHDILELQDCKIPRIETLRQEITECILNLKIGLMPLSGVKPLIDKIDQLT